MFPMFCGFSKLNVEGRGNQGRTQSRFDSIQKDKSLALKACTMEFFLVFYYFMEGDILRVVKNESFYVPNLVSSFNCAYCLMPNPNTDFYFKLEFSSHKKYNK